MNVGSRVIRAGFTNMRVLASAVSSAGIGGPASCLGVRGSMKVVVVGVAPVGQVHRGVGVSVGGVSAAQVNTRSASVIARLTARSAGIGGSRDTSGRLRRGGLRATPACI